MKPYHGLPITPEPVAIAAVAGGHAFVCHRHPEQLELALKLCQSIAVDNGAFPAWMAKKPITNWEPYYEFVAELHRYPPFDFAVIPDVIDGDEQANDALLAEWPWSGKDAWIGAPVWHLHESLERLERLALNYPRICLGSSGQFATVGSAAWFNRMSEAMDVVCDKKGRPVCKLHGLRMLDPDIFTRFPLASADSTNIARNVGIDCKWYGPYVPSSKTAKATVMRDRIESFQSPMLWERRSAPIQQGLFMEDAA